MDLLLGDEEFLFRSLGSGRFVLGGVERFRLVSGDLRRLFRSFACDFEDDGFDGEGERFRSVFNCTVEDAVDVGPFDLFLEYDRFLGVTDRFGFFLGVNDCFTSGGV